MSYKLRQLDRRAKAHRLVDYLKDLWKTQYDKGQSDLEIIQVRIPPSGLRPLFDCGTTASESAMHKATDTLLNLFFSLGEPHLETDQTIHVLLRAERWRQKGWEIWFYAYSARRLSDVTNFLDSDDFLEGNYEIS